MAKNRPEALGLGGPHLILEDARDRPAEFLRRHRHANTKFIKHLCQIAERRRAMKAAIRGSETLRALRHDPQRRKFRKLIVDELLQFCERGLEFELKVVPPPPTLEIETFGQPAISAYAHAIRALLAPKQANTDALDAHEKKAKATISPRAASPFARCA
jgi:hypothetical protein